MFSTMYLLNAAQTPWYEWVFSGVGPWILGLLFTGIVAIITRAINRKRKSAPVRKQIETLEQRTEELRLQAMPELWINGTLCDKINKELRFDLNNNGETAHLTEVKILSNNLKQYSIPFPCPLYKGKMIYLYFRYTGNADVDNDNFIIELYFKDKLSNKYRAQIFGKEALKITSTDFIPD